MPFTEDFSAFFNTSEHGTEATYNAAAVNGIFDKNYILAGEDFGVESVSPAFTCAAADVAGIAHGDTFTVNAVAYTVVGNQPDGTGVIVIILQAP